MKEITYICDNCRKKIEEDRFSIRTEDKMLLHIKNGNQEEKILEFPKSMDFCSFDCLMMFLLPKKMDI